ncbi:phenolic acid decarboxylase [Nocardia pseudovaccinii]|uniref:phenolic acid decarboxylase n=1 Tax=Nocardia pseudovaccinii TaxID=189540 RepID=UPI0007A45B62|nr:phenolic acid decarboxylase [Nocardia pseudovaccinii]
MLNSIVGKTLRLHLPNGWVFQPWFTGPDFIEYTLIEGPHAGRHAIQRELTYYKPAPRVEELRWYEETGTTVNLAFDLDGLTVVRWASVPRWLADTDMAVSAGDNQDPEFLEKIRQLAADGPDWPRHIYKDRGYFEVIDVKIPHETVRLPQ